MVSLSGCIGGLLGSNQQVITKTAFKPFKLVVSLREGASLSYVNLIAPDGTTVDRKPVSAGQTTVSFPLVASTGDYAPLSPGKYTIVAANKGETLAQQDIQLKAAWNVADVRPKEKRDLVITLQNTGDLPVKVKYLGVTKGVPTPNDPPQKKAIDTLIRINAPNRTELKQYLGNGKRATFRLTSDQLVFLKSASEQSVPQWKQKAAKCRGLTHKATLVLMVAPTGKRTYSVPITYRGKPLRGLGSRLCAKVTVGNASRTTAQQS